MNSYIWEIGKLFIGKKVERTTKYSKMEYEETLREYDTINMELCAKLKEYIKFFEPKTILEIGCGNGRNLKCIENDYICYGIELTDYGFEKAKNNCKHCKIYNGSAEFLPFSDSSIDLIFTVHALEQMPLILNRVIKEIHRVSAKGILLFEPLYERQGIWGKLHNRNNNYARNILKGFKKYNFDIVSVENADCSKHRFNTTWVVKGVKNIETIECD